MPESRFSRASFWMPLVLIDSICGFDERRESSVAPKKIGVSASGSILSPSLILICSLFYYIISAVILVVGSDNKL